MSARSVKTRAAIVVAGMTTVLAVGVVAAPTASALPRICGQYIARINSTWNIYEQTGNHADLMNYIMALNEAEDIGCL